jgi:hypothetical protein
MTGYSYYNKLRECVFQQALRWFVTFSYLCKCPLSVFKNEAYFIGMFCHSLPEYITYVEILSLMGTYLYQQSYISTSRPETERNVECV